MSESIPELRLRICQRLLHAALASGLSPSEREAVALAVYSVGETTADLFTQLLASGPEHGLPGTAGGARLPGASLRLGLPCRLLQGIL